MNRKALIICISMSLASHSVSYAAGSGQLDTKFNNDGLDSVAFDIGGNLTDWPFAQVEGLGGSTFVVGSAQVADEPYESVLAIAKYQPDGTLDPTYGDAGRVLHEVEGTGPSSVGGAALTPDGKLIVVSTSRKAGNADWSDDFGVVCQFDQRGKIDIPFGDDGCKTISPGGVGQVVSVAIRPDGGILLGGMYRTPEGMWIHPGIASLQKDGKSLDYSFGWNGVAFAYETAGEIDRLQITPSGQAMGLSYYYGEHGTVSTLFKIDATTGKTADFGIGGVLDLVLPLTYQNQRALDFAIGAAAAGEPIFLTGTSEGVPYQDHRRSFVAKLTKTGALAQTFGTGGVVEFEDEGTWGRAACAIELVGRGIVIGGDSNIVFPGQYKTWSALKLDSKGEIDLSFGDLGEKTLPFRGNSCEIGLQGSRVMMAGSGTASLSPADDEEFYAARLDHGLTEKFKVSPNAGPNGTISPASAVDVGHSDVQQFKLTPKFGYRVASVSGCGKGELIGTRYRTGPITNTCVVNVTFEKIPLLP